MIFQLLRRQQRLEHLIKSFDRRSLLQPLPVDKEGRCGGDAKGIARTRALRGDLIQKFLVRQALIEAFLGEAGLLRDIEQLRHGAALGKRQGSPVPKLFDIAKQAGFTQESFDK